MRDYKSGETSDERKTSLGEQESIPRKKRMQTSVLPRYGSTRGGTHELTRIKIEPDSTYSKLDYKPVVIFLK